MSGFRQAGRPVLLSACLSNPLHQLIFLMTWIMGSLLKDFPGAAPAGMIGLTPHARSGSSGDAIAAGSSGTWYHIQDLKGDFAWRCYYAHAECEQQSYLARA